METTVTTGDRPAGEVSLNAFAKLLGVNVGQVSQAARNGRLAKSVRWDTSTPPRAVGVQVELGKTEWAANADYSRHPERRPPPGEVSLGAPGLRAPGAPAPAPGAPGRRTDLDGLDPGRAADVRAKEASAAEKELSMRRAAGELIPAALVRTEWERKSSAYSTAVLAASSRLRQEHPEVPAPVFEALKKILREALQVLAKGGA